MLGPSKAIDHCARSSTSTLPLSNIGLLVVMFPGRRERRDPTALPDSGFHIFSEGFDGTPRVTCFCSPIPKVHLVSALEILVFSVSRTCDFRYPVSNMCSGAICLAFVSGSLTGRVGSVGSNRTDRARSLGRLVRFDVGSRRRGIDWWTISRLLGGDLDLNMSGSCYF